MFQCVNRICKEIQIYTQPLRIIGAVITSDVVDAIEVINLFVYTH